jgi:hypothetical protein
MLKDFTDSWDKARTEFVNQCNSANAWFERIRTLAVAENNYGQFEQTGQIPVAPTESQEQN